MNKNEFLQKLRQELSGNMKETAIQEQINYYSQYIAEEVGQGKDEEDVVSELGDPWVIAKTILDASENEEFARESGGGEPRRASRTSQGSEQRSEDGYRQVKVFGSNSKWLFLLIILGLIGIIMLLVAVVGGIISLLAPIAVPVLVIALVMRIFNNRRR